jgi:hypothetical protein
MSFFYDLNKKLDAIRETPSKTHGQLNERDMSRAAKGYEKYGKQGMEALAKAGREGKALDPVRKKYDKYDNKEVSEDFGPGREGPNRNQAGPSSFNPDSANYKTPTLDKMHDYRWQKEKDTGKRQGFDGFGGAADTDARGQQKYVDRTAPGVINKIKDKLGYDMPDTEYGPRPDERERLAKRYPKPTQERGGPAPAKSMVDKQVSKAKTPLPYVPAKPSKSAPKSNMGTIKGGVWTADPPKPGERGVPAPSGDPEGVPESGAPMTAKQKSFAKLAPPADKITFADKIAGAKKEVDEMLGDVAAEAMRKALGGGKGRNAEMDEANAFDYKSPRDDAPKAGSIEYGHKHDIKHSTSDPKYTGRTVTRRTDAQGISVGADDDSEDSGEKRGRGRPKGTKNVGSKAKVFQRKSKLMTKEGDVSITDQGEYDQEGDMAKDDIKTIVRHAQALSKVLGDDDNLPEWVQSKLAKIEGMMISIDEYMQNQAGDDEEEPIAEKAVSKNQAVAARIARGVQQGTAKAKPGSASAEMAKMKSGELKKFAKTDTKGLPKKVSKKKEVDENSEEGRLTTTRTAPGKTLTTSSTGRVSATMGNGKMSVKPGKSDKSMDDDMDTASSSTKDTSSTKSNSMVGKGIYDSMNRELELMIAESMSINMSDSTEGNKSLTVTATDEDAMRLAMMLKSAGLGGQGRDLQSDESCSTCGMQDCGCGDVHEAVDENAPDWPTNTETSSDALQYAGGLNKPKTDVAGDGQTTVPNTAVHTQEEDALRRMMEMAGIKTEVDLGPTSPEIARMSKDEVNAALRSGMNSKVDLGPTSPDIARMSSDEVNAALKLGMSPDISNMDSDSVNAEFGKDGRQYEDSIQRMREMAGIQEAKKDVEEEKTEEGNLFTGNLAKARADGKKEADLDGDGDMEKVRESIFSLTNQWKAYRG